MTLPPDSGWTDGNGTTHPGSPPPGYWIASDGRWYPPESASPAPAPAPVAPESAPPSSLPPSFGQPPTGEPSFGQPPTGQPSPGADPFTSATPAPGAPDFGGAPTESGGNKGKLIFLGVAGLLVLGLVGAVVVALAGGDDEDTATVAVVEPDEADSADDDEAGESSDADAGSDSDSAADSAADADADSDGDAAEAAEEPEAEPATPAPAPAGEPGTIACQRVSEDFVLLDFVNDSGVASNYWLTVAFFDDAGARVADESAFIDNVLPGDHVIEEAYMFEEVGSTCEVIDIDRTDVLGDPALFAEVSACVTGEPDFADDITGSISVTNGATVSMDYSVTVGFYDGSGIRRGTGSAFIETVRPGESAPSDVFTTVDYAADLTCEVVGVDRYESD